MRKMDKDELDQMLAGKALGWKQERALYTGGTEMFYSFPNGNCLLVREFSPTRNLNHACQVLLAWCKDKGHSFSITNESDGSCVFNLDGELTIVVDVHDLSWVISKAIAKTEGWM